jgi:hypothetical protein
MPTAQYLGDDWISLPVPWCRVAAVANASPLPPRPSPPTASAPRSWLFARFGGGGGAAPPVRLGGHHNKAIEAGEVLRKKTPFCAFCILLHNHFWDLPNERSVVMTEGEKNAAETFLIALKMPHRRSQEKAAWIYACYTLVPWRILNIFRQPQELNGCHVLNCELLLKILRKQKCSR